MNAVETLAITDEMVTVLQGLPEFVIKDTLRIDGPRFTRLKNGNLRIPGGARRIRARFGQGAMHTVIDAFDMPDAKAVMSRVFIAEDGVDGLIPAGGFVFRRGTVKWVPVIDGLAPEWDEWVETKVFANGGKRALKQLAAMMICHAAAVLSAN